MQMSKDIPHHRPEMDYHILPCMGFKIPHHIRNYPLNVTNILHNFLQLRNSREDIKSHLKSHWVVL